MTANVPGQMGFNGEVEEEAPKFKVVAGGKM